jgi:hypothetical protein
VEVEVVTRSPKPPPEKVLRTWAREWFKEGVNMDLGKLPSRPAFEKLPRRWVAERTFAWISHRRRKAKDHERLPETGEAPIYAVMNRPMARRLAHACGILQRHAVLLTRRPLTRPEEPLARRPRRLPFRLRRGGAHGKDGFTATATAVGRFPFVHDTYGASTRTGQHLGGAPVPATAARPLRTLQRGPEGFGGG